MWMDGLRIMFQAGALDLPLGLGAGLIMGVCMAWMCRLTKSHHCDGCGICEPDGVRCPVCGGLCEILYRRNGQEEVAGCDLCLTQEAV